MRQCMCGELIESAAYRPDGITPTCYRCYRYMILAKKLVGRKSQRTGT